MLPPIFFRRPSSLPPQPARELRGWCLLAAVVLFAVLATPYYLGRLYTSDDLWAYHLPVRKFYADCLATGQRFDWMPSMYAGFYLTGEGQAGTYHPLHWLLYRCLPLQAAFDLELLLNYPVTLAGMYCFLRRHVRRDAAMFGALVFTFSGFNLLHFVHPNALAVVAHLPWLLLAIHVAWTSPRRSRQIVAEASIALLTASQLLLGYPQYVWFSLLAEGAYVVWLWVTNPNFRFEISNSKSTAIPRFAFRIPNFLATRHSLLATFHSHHARIIRRIAIVKLLALLIGGIQLLPTLDVLAESERHSADASFAQQGGLHALNVLQWVGPYLFRDRVVGGNTHEFAMYLGVVPIVLLGWLALRWKSLGRRRWLAAAALLAAGLALLLALGRTGGLYILQTYLPIVGKFRFPARYIVLVDFALAIATAVAFADLARYTARKTDDRRPKLSWGPWARLIGASALVAILAGWLWGEHAASLLLRLIGPVLLAGAVVLVRYATHGRNWALPALIGLTALDLGVYGGTYAIWRNTFAPGDALSTLPSFPQNGSLRIATEFRNPSQPTLRVGNQLTLQGWQQLDGYAGLEPSRWLDYREVNALRIASVGKVLRSPVTESIAGLVPVDDRWLAVPEPVDYVRLVDDVVESREPNRDLATIDVATTALVERRPTTPAHQSRSEHYVNQIYWERCAPGAITLVGQSDASSWLVVGERFHAGWKAKLNGSPVDLVRTNGEFLGCATEEGFFFAEFEFLPDSLRFGRWLTAAGLILLSLHCTARFCIGSTALTSAASPLAQSSQQHT